MIRITIEYFDESDAHLEKRRTFNIGKNTNEFDFEAKFSDKAEYFQFRDHNQKSEGK